MIKRIENEAELSALPEKGIEAGKIRALFKAYGLNYDFCRFYKQRNCLISSLDGAFVICNETKYYPELAEFISMNGYSEIFCSEPTGKGLQPLLSAEMSRVNLLKYCGGWSNHLEITENPSLSEVYEILQEGFGIEFEPWYLDMSHRIRHGITQCFTLDGISTLTVQHNLCGEALISQVATKLNARGQGSATKLIQAVCERLSPSEVFVICEDRLLDFYRNAGFNFVCRKAILTR